jgi:hypothetical protein
MIVNMVGARCRSAIDARSSGSFLQLRSVSLQATAGSVNRRLHSTDPQAERVDGGPGSAEQRCTLRRVRDVVVCRAGS